MPEEPAKLDETLDAKPYEPPKLGRSIVRYCIVIGALVALDLLEAVVHLVYGAGCWGFQPGGHASMYVAEGLAITFIVTAIMALTSAQRGMVLATRLGAVCLGVLIIVVTYSEQGWVMFTSGHGQGSKNLVMFGVLNLGIILITLTGLDRRESWTGSAGRVSWVTALLIFALVPVNFFVPCRVSGWAIVLSLLLLASTVILCFLSKAPGRLNPFVLGAVGVVLNGLAVH